MPRRTSRVGKMADSVFAPPPARPSTPPAAAKGQSNGDYIKTTLILWPRQMNSLDKLAMDIRTKTGAAVSRTEAIRGILDGVEAAGIDLTGCHDENDIKAAIVATFKTTR